MFACGRASVCADRPHAVHIDGFCSEHLFWPQIAVMGRGEFFGEVEVFNDIARTSGGCEVCMCVCRVCMYRCAYATLCDHDFVIYIYIYYMYISCLLTLTPPFLRAPTPRKRFFPRSSLSVDPNSHSGFVRSGHRHVRLYFVGSSKTGNE